MQTQLLKASDLDVAVSILRDGGLVAFPTETVYGLGGNAENGEAVASIYAAKGRPVGHPLIVHVASADAAWTWAVHVPAAARALAERFWPGPLTLILPRSPRAHPETVGGRDSVGLRVPNHPLTLRLLSQFGGGVAGPSANRFGHVSPTTAAHVMSDLDGRIDAVLDGGPSRVGVESTIVEIVGEQALLLRPGGVTLAELNDALAEAGLDDRVVDGRGGESRAAGMLASHYAPHAPMRIVDEVDSVALEPGDVLIRPRPAEAPASAASGRNVIWLPADPEGFAEGLYAALRDADRACEGEIVVVRPAEGRLSAAINDRLEKASTR